MARTKTRTTNRFISLISLIIFFLSLVVVALVTTHLISLYQENKRLERQRDQIIADNAKLQALSEKLSDPDYYSVFVDGDLSILDGVIIIIF